MVIRLLTLNCYSLPFDRTTRPRLETIAQEVQALSLDVVCFQEVHLWRYARLLARSLPEYAHSASAPYLYTPRGGLLTLSRHPIARQRFVLYEKRGRLHSPGFADWLLHKGILIAELTLPHTPVVIVNTHLLANYNADWSHGNHYARHQGAELEQLLHTLDEIERDRLVIVVGDFNIPTGTRLYGDFVRAAGLIDPLASSAQPTFRPPRFLPAHYALPLDHVLVRAPAGQLPEVSAQIVLARPVRLVNGIEAYLSDHSAILAEVKL
ncbi:MAG: endonuclease/exonuclease/phosphatase family protein [Anaerolineae bacterium]